jgi:hypothetical protein
MRWRDCREVQAFIAVPEENVRSRVPAAYALARSADGRALVFVRTIACEAMIVDGVSAPAKLASFGAVVEPPGETGGCFSRTIEQASGALADAAVARYCDDYAFFGAFDNARVVAWFRQGTPTIPAYHVRDFSNEYRDTISPVEPNFHARIGRPAPSRFEMTAIAEHHPCGCPMHVGIWRDTPTGRVKFSFESGAIDFGRALVEVRAERGSEMAEILGATTRNSDLAFSLVAGSPGWGFATFSKEILPLD